ncbi:MAG: glucose-6-phosphate dehydrogenase [Chlamydiales bacterium]|jgi:glucose-6-phosphate 1-dehydrogenase|nr:glucose-6-phosphate dehydrogenase [Chlamydiales bacterium]
MPDSPLQEPGISTRFVNPCILIIFGATGDLTARKLLPALYNLAREGQLPPQFACVGFARKKKTNELFRKEVKEALDQFSRVKPIDESLWKHFQEQIFYYQSEFHDERGYKRLQAFLQTLDVKLDTRGNRVFYLATQPSFFLLICENLHKADLIYKPQERKKFSRLIIEKPFGYDLSSAQDLQQKLLCFLQEDQIYRIDHYLGKETVQNILVFRFANSLFESLWNRHYIDHVQITVAESMGIGTRGAFWEEAGLLRDIVQNHMMQLLSLMAMEPPINLKADSIRNEKVKVLQAIRPFNEEDMNQHVIRGQYSSGYINAEPVVGYREEKNVSAISNVETFTALRLFIDNWRWSGVPFYLRAGKRLPKRATEIALVFKHPPGILFQNPAKKNEANVLALRIQPDEGTSLKINCKVPGLIGPIQPVKMDFRYGSYFGINPPEAYERLILDCMLGDNTLFARQDEVYNSWKFITPILEYFSVNIDKGFPNYAAGSWGPKATDQLLLQDKRKWRLI